MSDDLAARIAALEDAFICLAKALDDTASDARKTAGTLVALMHEEATRPGTHTTARRTDRAAIPLRDLADRIAEACRMNT